MKRTASLMAWVLVAAGLTYVGAAAVTGPDRATPAQFQAYATGTALHVHAVQSLPTRVVDADLAFSGAVANSNGLPPCDTTNGNGCVKNEMNVIVQPTCITVKCGSPAAFTPVAGKRSSGRGSGLELSLGNNAPTVPAAATLPLTGIAEATAPPDTPLHNESTDVPADPLLYAGLLTGQAQAKFSDLLNQCPVLGMPDVFGFGRGFIADAQLLNAGGPPLGPTSKSGLIETDARLNDQGVFDPNGTNHTTLQTVSKVVPIANGDGTFGLQAIIQSDVVPISVNLPPDQDPTNNIVIVVGKSSLILTATGKVGDPRNGIQYVPAPTPNLVIPATTLGGVQSIVPLPIGDVTIPGLLDLAVAEGTPRAIGGSGPATSSATAVSAAVDGVRIQIPPNLVPTVVDPQVIDLRVQHFEGSLQVPAGGFSFNSCGRIRVSKAVVGNLSGPFAFHMDCPGVDLPAAVSDFTLNAGASQDVVGPSGKTCLITETNNGGASQVSGTITNPDGTSASTAMPATVTFPTSAFGATGVAPNDFATRTLTVLNQNVGNLKVSKISQQGLNGPFGFTADCRDAGGTQLPNGTGNGQVLRTFNLTPNQSVTFTNLPGGTNCTVAEVNPGGAAVTRITDSTGPNNSDGKVRINGGDLQTVTFSNAGPPLVITKLATGEAGGKGPFSFHLDCTTPGGAAVALDPADADFTLASGDDHVITKDLPDGSVCKATENNSAGATSVVITDTQGATDDSTVTVQHLFTQVIAFNNNFAPQIKLLVAKKVSGTGSGPFAFHVACVNATGGAVTLAAADADFTLNDGQSHGIKSLPDGSRCTVTETNSKGASVSYNDTTAPATDGVVVIPTGNAASTVTVTNTFVAPQPPPQTKVQPRTVG